ncbi:hypothetical protein O181_069285 [Austropuccinia psidii MF-1]|uniref:Uncharacterized protein n=1 Tax=Austropuccinia psidii MF-1 TaxID=1389203 RepID=A0A9Q3I7X7_9BASI|nr:hypothetical protein [Austropuccinia psidii MF-1]
MPEPLLWSNVLCECLMACGPHPFSLVSHGPRPYPALIGLLGQQFTSSTPRPVPLVLGLGGPVTFQGPLASLVTTRALGPTPLIMGSRA